MPGKSCLHRVEFACRLSSVMIERHSRAFDRQSPGSGMPAGYDGITADGKGLPVGYDGMPAGYAGIAAEHDGMPAGYDGMAAEHAGMPAGYAGMAAEHERQATQRARPGTEAPNPLTMWNKRGT